MKKLAISLILCALALSSFSSCNSSLPDVSAPASELIDVTVSAEFNTDSSACPEITAQTVEEESSVPAEAEISSDATTTKPLVTTTEATTTKAPLVTTTEATTTKAPLVTTTEATTTKAPVTTTTEATTTKAPVTTTTEATTTKAPVTTTTEATTTKAPVTTTTEATTTKAPVVTTTEATTTKAPVTTTTEATTTTAATTSSVPTASGTASSVSAADQQRMLDLVNGLREELGIAPLKLCDDAVLIAQIRAEECAEYYSHTRPDGSAFYTIYKEMGISYSMVGENIGRGTLLGADPVSTFFNLWKNSTAHYENMVSERIEYFGYGCYQVGGETYVAQAFIDYC